MLQDTNRPYERRRRRIVPPGEGLPSHVLLLLRRRWLVAGALAVVGLEAVRGTIDVVNRLPSWALFGGSGAILLTGGFVLLLKREAWNAWSRRAYDWWARL